MPWYIRWRSDLDKYRPVHAVRSKVLEIHGNYGTTYDLLPAYFYPFDSWKPSAPIYSLSVSPDYVRDIYRMRRLLLLHDALVDF